MIAILITTILLLLIMSAFGKDKEIYEEIATNPKTQKALRIFGDSLYGIGISVAGAGAYGLLIDSGSTSSNVLAMLLGGCAILLGAYLKE